MELKALVQQLPAARVEGPLEREIVGVAYDSRRVTPGMLFVAVPGLGVDGHEFIASAVERGAAAIVCERNGLVSQRATTIRVADARDALARVAAAFYEHPSARIKVIGITGTSGKTMVAFLLKQVLEAAGWPTGLISSVRYEVGERVIPAQRTTPEALEIQQMLAGMVRAGCRACVLEVSSHALDQRRVAAVEFDAAVFTNLTPDHLDYHPGMEAYFAAKQRLFTALQAGTKRGGAIINIDDAYGQRLAAGLAPEVLLTYGLGEGARVRATGMRVGREATEMTVEGPGVRFDCQVPLIGRHNVYNALAAVGASLVLGVPAWAIQTALGAVQPVPGRLEPIVLGQPFGVLVDYAHTEDSLRHVLATLREITPGRLLLTFGCGGTRDTGKRRRMGAVAAALADTTIITTDNPRKEPPEAIATEIAAGYHAVRGEACAIELDRRRAIDALIRLARPGDTVLLAGKGHETYQEFQDTVVPFDDRVYARETLRTLGFSQGEAPERC